LAARRSEILEEAGRGAEEARAEAERAVEEEHARGAEVRPQPLGR